MKIVWKVVCLLIAVFVLNFFARFVRAADYNVSSSLDFTGPLAIVGKSLDTGQRIFFEWWNETKGSKLGITLHRKAFDSRYDPSVISSLWPGILAKEKPIAHFGMGLADTNALMARLSNDKVPLFSASGAGSMVWVPNLWLFNIRPTYMHEWAAFLNWVHKTSIKNRPVKIANITTKAAAFVDSVIQLEKFAKETNWVELVGIEYVEVKPVSVLSEMRRLARKKPDFILIGSNTSHVIATIKAQQELGIHIPVVASAHNGIQLGGRAAGDIKLFEGHYDVYACDPAIDMNIPGARIFTEYKKKMGVEEKWDIMIVNEGARMALFGRAVERAAAKVGANKITGEAVYQAMYEGPFTREDMLGLTDTLAFSKEAAFPLKGIHVKSTTVKNGKQVLTTEDWIPGVEIQK
jgi:branched-chain amino acid transport system substrate-binding protein